MSFCGNIPMSVWEYLLNSISMSDQGCRSLRLIQVDYDSCEMPCAFTQMHPDMVVHSLFTHDVNGKNGLRVSVVTEEEANVPCTPLFSGERSIFNFIGTGADGKPVLLIFLSTLVAPE